MIFGRIKPLDAILATAEKKSLKRSLGAMQLTLLGIGSVIGTGIFVLTASGAQKAGPGLMLAFVIAGAVCIVAALCYAEIAAMILESSQVPLRPRSRDAFERLAARGGFRIDRLVERPTCRDVRLVKR